MNDDLQKMYAVLTAPDAQQTTPAQDDDDDDGDVLFAADMTTKELEAMLAPMLAEAIEREWQKAVAAANAPKVAPKATTKETKARRITTTKGTITFKG